MIFEDEINLLLKPGYLPLETGYYRLPNGQMYVAALIPMPGCKGKWIDWWFGTHLQDTKTFREWSPEVIHFNWDEKWKPGHYLGACTYLEAPMGNNVVKQIRRYVDPAKYFDTSKFTEAGIEAAICAENFNIDGTPDGRVVHLVRHTDNGCEIRIRFWTNNTNDEIAQYHMEKSFFGMLRLADLLRTWDKEAVTSGNDIAIYCKFCQSDQVVKNGLRKNTQTWLCKNCGHSFTDNHALPKMRYPAFTIASAVHDYYDGHSVRKICAEIERATGIMPSSSTVHGWIKKLTARALSEETGHHPAVGDSWILQKTPIEFANTKFCLMSIIDIDTRFILTMRLFENAEKIDSKDIQTWMLAAFKKASKKPKSMVTNIGENYINRAGSANEATLKDIHIISVTDKEISKIFEHPFPNMIKNRLRPRNNTGLNNIDTVASNNILLKGFAFHHNYISLQNNSFDIPAKAAGIKLPLKDWMCIIERETLS